MASGREDGDTCLRILHGLDRFSENMDFSLIAPDDEFDIGSYCSFVENELQSWGFAASVAPKSKTAESAIESAFLKADTREQLLLFEIDDEIVDVVPPGSRLKIKIEVDTDPPPDFQADTGFVLQPIPFSVRAYRLPSLFAGKMHAVLCRDWKGRVKGRDWYDMVWYVARGTKLDLGHLEARMRQTGHHTDEAPLDMKIMRGLLGERIERLDPLRARADVARFLTRPESVEVWSREFFRDIADRIVPS